MMMNDGPTHATNLEELTDAVRDRVRWEHGITRNLDEVAREVTANAFPTQDFSGRGYDLDCVDLMVDDWMDRNFEELPADPPWTGPACDSEPGDDVKRGIN